MSKVEKKVSVWLILMLPNFKASSHTYIDTVVCFPET